MNDPTDRYAQRLPTARPPGLRLGVLNTTWYRIEREAPDGWAWRPFPTARYRFDSASGAFRVRYAGDAQRVAMRERFDDFERTIRSSELELRLVELTGAIQVLDLRRDRTLDVLGLDDQINTGRAAGVWAACQLLVDLVHDWFEERCHGIVYRSRTTPERSANLAFFAHTQLRARDLGPLAEHGGLLVECATVDGFTIQGWR